MKTERGCDVQVRHCSARIYESGHFLAGRKFDAAVIVNFGSDVEVGQFTVHLAPGDARRIAAMLIASAAAADESEAELAAAQAEAA